MPEFTSQPESMDTPPVLTPAAPLKPRLSGWRKALFIAAMIAACLRLLMFLLLHFPTRHAAQVPTWPVHADDVLTFTPGDPAIERWAEHPTNDGFLVQQVERNGVAVTDMTICAMEPDYMAADDQPGGTMTVLAQQPTGEWPLHWFGGDTLPESAKTADFDANCGKDAVVLMSSSQLHDLVDILAGRAASPSGPLKPEGPSPTPQLK